MCVCALFHRMMKRLLKMCVFLCVLQGAYFYRIIDQFIDQAGVEVESTYGGMFRDDQGGLQIKHIYKVNR